MKDVKCPYTKEMIESERTFLDNLENFINEKELKNLKTDSSSAPIGNLVPLSLGTNKGECVPIELRARLEEGIAEDIKKFDLTNIDFETDVIIVGSGGAGLCAAIEAAEHGVHTLILTKEKYGQSNTILAQGGIQAATEADDSVDIHFEDTMKSGHNKNNPELVRKLTSEAPEALKWLSDLGVNFKEEPLLAGGASKKRLHAIGDTTGAAIMKVLSNKILELKEQGLITIKKYADVKEIVKDSNGNVAGVIYRQNDEKNKNGDYKLAKAKSVVLATGGSGSLGYNNFNTSNCKGITGDGLAMAYHAGAKLVEPAAIQYHPTGGAFPINLAGKLVSEKARSLGALLFNKNGEPLQSMGNRDQIVKIIMSEVNNHKGIKTPSGNSGVWLATPLIDKIHGEGTIKQKLPRLYKEYMAYGIDITKHAILIYPTIHYQLGGIEIDSRGMTNIPNLFAVGELSGGIDGENRLMGNALAMVVVYGRTAGREAAEIAKSISLPDKLSLSHLEGFPTLKENELDI